MKLEKSVDNYIDNFSPEIKERLSIIRRLVKKLAPVVEEKIAWGMPGYKLNGRPLLYFAGFKSHIGIYPLPETIRKLDKELSGFKLGKGSIQFPYNKPLPLELIKKIIRFRVKELGN